MDQTTHELGDNYKRSNIHVLGIPEEEREIGTEAILEAIMTKNFPQINIKQQTEDPGSSVNTK